MIVFAVGQAGPGPTKQSWSPPINVARHRSATLPLRSGSRVAAPRAYYYLLCYARPLHGLRHSCNARTRVVLCQSVFWWDEDSSFTVPYFTVQAGRIY